LNGKGSQLAEQKIFLGDIAKTLVEIYLCVTEFVEQVHIGYGNYRTVCTRGHSLEKRLRQIKSIFKDVGHLSHQIDNKILKVALQVASIDIQYHTKHYGWGKYSSDISEYTLNKLFKIIEPIKNIPFNKWKNPYN